MGLQCILMWLCFGRDLTTQLAGNATKISRVLTSTGLHRYQPDCNFNAIWISLWSNCPGILTSSSRLLTTLCIFGISRKLKSAGNQHPRDTNSEREFSLQDVSKETIYSATHRISVSAWWRMGHSIVSTMRIVFASLLAAAASRLLVSVALLPYY